MDGSLIARYTYNSATHIAGRFDYGIMVICSVGNEFTVAADLILPELVIVSAVVVQIYRNGVAVSVEGGNRSCSTTTEPRNSR